jgi:hypothetical protein
MDGGDADAPGMFFFIIYNFCTNFIMIRLHVRRVRHHYQHLERQTGLETHMHLESQGIQGIFIYLYIYIALLTITIRLRDHHH